MRKLYSLFESVNISSTASLSIGTVSNGFNKIYPIENFWYYRNDSQVEKRFSYSLDLGCGLTYSYNLENSIAPYGSVLSINIGPGMTLSNCNLVVDKVSVSQIDSDNSPNINDVLSYNGSGLTWVSKLSIDDVAKFFGVTCGSGYQPVGTYSYDGYKYTLKVLCEYIGTTTTTTGG
jgi:hypothetical protein